MTSREFGTFDGATVGAGVVAASVGATVGACVGAAVSGAGPVQPNVLQQLSISQVAVPEPHVSPACINWHSFEGPFKLLQRPLCQAPMHSFCVSACGSGSGATVGAGVVAASVGATVGACVGAGVSGAGPV